MLNLSYDTRKKKRATTYQEKTDWQRFNKKIRENSTRVFNEAVQKYAVKNNGSAETKTSPVRRKRASSKGGILQVGISRRLRISFNVQDLGKVWLRQKINAFGRQDRLIKRIQHRKYAVAYAFRKFKTWFFVKGQEQAS